MLLGRTRLFGLVFTRQAKNKTTERTPTEKVTNFFRPTHELGGREGEMRTFDRQNRWLKRTKNSPNPRGRMAMCKFNMNIVSYTFCQRTPLPTRVCADA